MYEKHQETSVSVFSISSVAGLMLLNFSMCFPRMRKMNEIDKTNSELSAESGKKNERIEYLTAQADKLTAELKISSHDFVKRDRMICQS